MDTRKLHIGRFFHCYDHSVAPTPWARASAALMAVFLQLPAFFSACTPPPYIPVPAVTKSSAPAREACLDVFFFEDDPLRRLDAYQRFTGTWPDTLPTLSRSGPKQMVVLTNASQDRFSWSDLRSFNTLAERPFHLQDEDLAWPREWALTRVEGGVVRRADLTLRPLLCRILLHSLQCDFADRPYRHASLEQVHAFLTYVRTDTCPLLPGGDRAGSWCNPGYLDQEGLRAFAHPELVSAPLADTVGQERIYPGLSLYCYPNASGSEGMGTPVTTLVIAGLLEGRPTYYPIRLGALEAGVCYALDLTFTRAGASDPDSPVASGTFSLDVKAAPWSYRNEAVIRYE